MKKVHVPPDVQVSLTPKEDHRMVAANIIVSSKSAPNPCYSTVCFNKWNLGSEQHVECFRSHLDDIELDRSNGIEGMVESFNKQVRHAAAAALGPRSDHLRQPWITADTWVLVRTLAPSR